MKTYDEMTASVLARRDAYVKRRTKQRKAVMAGALASMMTAMCLLTATLSPNTAPGISAPPASSGTLSLPMESRLYLSAGGEDTLLSEGLTLPVAYTLSVQDIRGLSEEEIDSVYTIEQEAAQNVAYEHADTIAHASTLRRENVIVSLVRLGTIELEIDDPRKVAFISGKTTTDYGRVEFFYSPVVAIPKDEYGPFCDNEMTLSGEYYQILLRQQQNGKGRLEINWRPSSLLYDTIDQNPDLPLSTFRDTFFLCVEYNNGFYENHLIEIAFGDDGVADLRYQPGKPYTVEGENE